MSTSSVPLTLGSQLKAVRLVRGLSRRKLGDLVNMKADYIRMIEHDYITSPRTGTVALIASALGCKVTVSVVAVDGSESEER